MGHMDLSPIAEPVLVAIPSFGAAELTDQVLHDLLDARTDLLPKVRIVVVDNAGDYVAPRRDERLEVFRSGRNLRWINSANWALQEAQSSGAWASVVINNDTRLSPDFLYWLVRTFSDCTGVAAAAPCYDDFWLHQRATVLPLTAADYAGVLAYRSVLFCDATAWAVSVSAAREVGLLDAATFSRHGYGSDLDYAFRSRALGLRTVVTDAAYLSHLRRGTMDRLPNESSERNRAEIVTGMDAKWGPDWRTRAGLSPIAFTGAHGASAQSWYA